MVSAPPPTTPGGQNISQQCAGNIAIFDPTPASNEGVITVGGTGPLSPNGRNYLELANSALPATAPTNGIGMAAVGGVAQMINSQGLLTIVGGSQGGITSPVTVANTAAETLLQGLTLPANDAIAGAVYRLRGWGQYSDTGTPTLTFTLRLGGTGGTLLAQVPAITLGSGVSAVPFEYEALVNFLSPTTVQALIDLGLGTSAASDAESPFVATPSAAVTVSISTSKVLQLDVTWSAASASNTISLLGGYTERVA